MKKKKEKKKKEPEKNKESLSNISFSHKIYRVLKSGMANVPLFSRSFQRDSRPDC